MTVTTRAVLVVHPDAECRTQLRSVLAGYEVFEATNRQEAVEFLARAPPALVLTHPEPFPRLLKDLERYAPRAIRAVLCPRDSPRTHHNLVDVAAAGHMFFTLDDAPGPGLRRSVLDLLELRESERQVPRGSLEARFVADGTAFRAELLDVGTGGLGLRLQPSVRIERLTPGTVLEGLQVMRGSALVLRAGHATVRMVRPVRGQDGGFHLGVSLERPVEHSRSSPAPLLQDAVRIRGLLRRAVRAGVGFGLRTHEGNRLVDFATAEVHPEASRLMLREQSRPGALFHPGDLVQLCLDFGGVCHVGTTAVMAVEENGLEIALPRSLSLHHRRNSLRFRSTAERPFAVSFASPFTGELLYRPLLDLHTGGFAFPFDGTHEVFPPGLVLDEVTLHLPDGTRSRCRAQVQDTGLLTAMDEGGSMMRPRRCGVRILELAPEARTAVLDAFITARCSDARDGSELAFSDIWDLFRAAEVRFPDYPYHDGPPHEALLAGHRTLGNGTHGLSKTIVYQREGRLYGHISGLRIYSRTWLSQHLVVRPGYHRHESISQELVALAADYAESLEDVEYLRALWRCRNRWTSRIYGAIASRLERPGLSCLHAFTPCRLPVDAALPPAREDLRVRVASTSDLRWLEQHLRETQDVVRLRSSDLVEGEMSLGTLGGRYTDVGLRRARSIAMVEGRDGPKGFVLMEDSSPGLFWAEWYNAFSLVMVEQDAREADAVRHALVKHAVGDAARRGRPTAECLATDADLPSLEGLGFHNLGKVMEFTAHRQLVRDWNAYLLAVFERLAAHTRGGTKPDDKDIAA
ncbi:response regulator [Pyxidicoccus trucidator]|uniref:response regulator n=1 Tax=Pyxidicoccus trucidator TaxID=2709662 RepID=UPI0013DA4293|nr:response regulator [Pyxidicoccus trucidator]